MLLLLPILCWIALNLLFYSLRKSWREAFLFASLGIGVLVFLITEGLSLLHAVNRTGIAISWTAVLVMMAALLVWQKDRWKGFRIHLDRSLIKGEEWALAAGILLLVLLNGYTAWQTPPNNWDAMVYHLPRVMHWLSNGSVNFYATAVNRQLFLNPGIEYGFLHLIALSGNDQWVNLLGVLIWLAGALMASTLAKSLGANPRAQALSAVVCLLIPSSILQAGTPKNDLLLGYWVLAALTAFFEFKKKPSWAYALALGAAIGLAILTKTTAYVILTPLVLWFVAWGLWKLKFQLLQYGGVIVLVLVLLNAPQLFRNQRLYGSPMGPVYETGLYHNESYGVRVLISNSLRNLAMEVRGPQVYNSVLFKGLERVHAWIGMGISDPATTWEGYTFDLPPLRINEDEMGAPLHLGLLLVALGGLLFSLKHKENHDILLLAGMLVLGFLLFSAYLRWQLWQTRLMIAFCMSAAVVIGILLARVKSHWVASGVVAVMLLMGMVCVWKNPIKPLPYLYDYNIGNMPRSLVMIYDLSLQESYMAAIETLDRDLHCDQVGVVMDNADWEYPFWTFLGRDGSEVRIEHVLVQNESARYSDAGFVPCAVMVMTEDRPVLVDLPEGITYVPYLETSELTLYVPDHR